MNSRLIPYGVTRGGVHPDKTEQGVAFTPIKQNNS